MGLPSLIKFSLGGFCHSLLVETEVSLYRQNQGSQDRKGTVTIHFMDRMMKSQNRIVIALTKVALIDKTIRQGT